MDEQIESGKTRRQSHGHRRVSLLGDLSACPESNMHVDMRGWSVVRSRLSTGMPRLSIVTLGRTRHLTTHAVNRLRGAADLHVLTAGRGLVRRLPARRTRWWAWLASDFPSGTRRSQQRAGRRARARSACRLQQPGSSLEAAGTWMPRGRSLSYRVCKVGPLALIARRLSPCLISSCLSGADLRCCSHGKPAAAGSVQGGLRGQQQEAQHQVGSIRCAATWKR